MNIQVECWLKPTVADNATISRLALISRDAERDGTSGVFYIRLCAINVGLPLSTNQIVIFPEDGQAQIVPSNYVGFQSAIDDSHHWGWQNLSLCDPGELERFHEQVMGLGEGIGLWINPENQQVYVGRDDEKEPKPAERSTGSSLQITPQMIACLSGNHVPCTGIVGIAGLGLGSPSRLVSCRYCHAWYEPIFEPLAKS